MGPALATLNFLGYHIYIAANARFGGSTSYNLYLNYPWIAWHHLSLDLTMSHMNRLDKVLGIRDTIPAPEVVGAETGDVLRFTVNGQPIGSTVRLTGNGGTVELEASAESILPIHTLQIVRQGRVVAHVATGLGNRLGHGG